MKYSYFEIGLGLRLSEVLSLSFPMIKNLMLNNFCSVVKA